MERTSWGERAGDWGWFLAWGLLSSVWCVLAGGQLGATFDEPLYLVRGLERWRSGSCYPLLQLGTMPLPIDVATLPLYLVEQWRGQLFNFGDDLVRLLPWARLGTLLFWWVLLLYARLAGRQMAGPWGGRLAVALIACEPSFLAHASLATTDIAITACLLALVYHFRTSRDAGWFWRVGVPAFWFAAAVLAKASGLVFGPICLLAVELERLLTAAAAAGPPAADAPAIPPPAWRRWLALLQPWRRDVVQVFCLGMVLVFVYCGSDWKPQASFLAWAHTLPEGPFGRSMVWLAEHLRIFSNAGEGLVRQVKHNVRGHGVFLLGKSHFRAFWYYFPVALTIKLSLPLLLLPVVLGILRPRALLNWACVAALALLAFSLTCRVQIGIRLVLPLVALGTVGVAAAAVTACRKLPRPALRRLLAGGVAGGLAWTVGAAVLIWPHGLCYINEAWGGPELGWQRLSDSNYDWGQGLPELARWQREHTAGPLDVWYFGTDPLLRTLPMRELPLHGIPVQRPEEVRAYVTGRYLAVSTTLFSGVAARTEAYRQVLAFLASCQPVARTTTFLIYDFTGGARGPETVLRAAP